MRIRQSGFLFMIGLPAMAVAGPSSHLAAQIPGASSVNVDREVARFRASILEQVRPVMDTWQDAWRGQGDRSIESHYAPDAVLALPDGSMIGGREEIAGFADTARSGIGALLTSLRDFEPADRMAFVYGTWDASTRSGGARETGRHATILKKMDDQWLIRSQMLGADSIDTGIFPHIAAPQPLPPLASRAESGRGSPYYELAAAMALLRRAWGNDDGKTLATLLRDEAVLQLPGRQAIAGSAMLVQLTEALSDYGSLNTVELDFDRGGTLAYLSGRYYVQNMQGQPRTGTYTAVFRNLGSGWRVRALLFF